MNDAGFDDAGDDCTDEGDGEGVVNVIFEGGVGVVVAVVGEDVEERADEVEGFAGDVGDLEDGANTLGDKLRGGLDGVSAVFDEDRDFARARGFEDPG